MLTCSSTWAYFYLTCSQIYIDIGIRSSLLVYSYHIGIQSCTATKLIVREYIYLLGRSILHCGFSSRFLYFDAAIVISYRSKVISCYIDSKGLFLTALCSACSVITDLILDGIRTCWYSCWNFHLTCCGIKGWHWVTSLWGSWSNFSNRHLVWPCSYSRCSTIEFCTIKYISYFGRGITSGRIYTAWYIS